MVLKRMELYRYPMLVISCIVLCACQSDSSPQPDSQDSKQIVVDYTGVWMTACIPINDRNSNTVRLELDNNGSYYMELYGYEGQDCNSIENRYFSRIDTGRYEIHDTVAVPSGVVAHDVTLFVESRVLDGEAVSVSDDQGFFDFMHRDGNKLFRATGQRVGVAGVFFPEDINFSVVYYLQE